MFVCAFGVKIEATNSSLSLLGIWHEMWIMDEDPNTNLVARLVICLHGTSLFPIV